MEIILELKGVHKSHEHKNNRMNHTDGESLQQALVTGQISPTGIDHGTIVSSCRCSSHSGAVIGPN